jgi:hypothetical protein
LRPVFACGRTGISGTTSLHPYQNQASYNERSRDRFSHKLPSAKPLLQDFGMKFCKQVHADENDGVSNAGDRIDNGGMRQANGVEDKE